MRMAIISERLIAHLRFRCLRPSGSGIAIFDISLSYSLQKSSIIQKISVILSLVISIMIVFFVYNILIFNYKDTKNYRDYQLFKRISYPELRFLKNQEMVRMLFANKEKKKLKK